MDIQVTPGISGRIHIAKHKANGEITETREFNNIFLMSGYRYIVRRQTVNDNTKAENREDFCLFLGTGTSEPSVYDTGLESRSTTLGAAGLSNSKSSMEALTGLHGEQLGTKYVATAFKLTYRYGEGQAEGVWTEMGLGDSAYSTPLTRALIRDDTGTATSLTVLADEFLTVTYTIKYAVNPISEVGTTTLNGVTSTMRFGAYAHSEVADTGGTWNTYYHLWGFGLAYSESSYYSSRLVYSTAAYYTNDAVTLYTGRGARGAPNAQSITLDDDGLGITYSATINPTDADMGIHGLHMSDVYILEFTPPLSKPADHKTTLNVSVRLVPEGYDPALDPTATTTTA